MHRRRLLQLPLLACTGACAQPQPPWREGLPGAGLVGRGSFRWLGLRIYTARLWAPQGRWQPDQPHVLELDYHRPIARERFVQASLDEMRRVRPQAEHPALLAQWRRVLESWMVDVHAGDVLAGLHRPGQGCSFYDAARRIGETADADFADAFFGIWLDPRTRDPGLRLRLRLLGLEAP